MFETATVHGTIAVSDLDRARKFYEGMLGFQVKDERSDGVRYEDAAGHDFLIYPSEFAGTDKSTHISFEVSDVEKAAAELRERGVVFEEYDLPGIKTVNGIAEIQGVKGGWFKDPDGNILALAELTEK
jgi:catechol 2,3-dioxygenase-like lactoylglutathione lyase family enzyme